MPFIVILIRISKRSNHSAGFPNEHRSNILKNATKKNKSEFDKRSVHTFIDVFDNILGSIREPLVVLDSDLKVVKANRSFYRTFNVEQGKTEGISIYDLGNRQWNIPKLRELLEDILPQKNIEVLIV